MLREDDKESQNQDMPTRQILTRKTAKYLTKITVACTIMLMLTAVMLMFVNSSFWTRLISAVAD